MDKQRFLLFFVLSMGILLVWTNFVAPVFFPPPPAQNRDVARKEEPAADDDERKGEFEAEQQPGQEGQPKLEPKGDADEETPKPDPANDPPPERDQAEPLVADWNPEQNVNRTFTLGSLDPETGYFMEVEVTTAGAGVNTLTLSDPRYRTLEDLDKQLSLLNLVDGVPPSLATTFSLDHPKNPAQNLLNANLIEWDVARDEQGQERIEQDPDRPKILKGITFRGVFEELGLEVLKTFRLEPSQATGKELVNARNTELSAYELQLEIAIRNLTDKPQSAVYLLQGPAGMPLENKENTNKFRQIAMGFIEPTGALRDELLTASAIVDNDDRNVQETWTRPFRYLGIDLQYFAALLVPDTDQSVDQQIEFAQPLLTRRDRTENHSDISLLFGSRRLELLPSGGKREEGVPGDRVSHSFKLLVGPKRGELLDPIEAGSILDYGTMGALAGVMLWVLNGLHAVGIPYWIAIIILTIIVRGCLFPLSKKQVIGAQKMKELQPKLQELKKKYGKDKEKMARAQMELFRKHNYNPLAGCLPILLQLPIFISLYTALSTSVDLRLAPFLWADNLAAPDALFRMPFALPFLGQNFNLLPIITIVLFIVQQKMFMPPPTSEEQAMQYKMMKVMMIVMGFLFYRVPAGLCIYFIASSLWGIGERKMLDMYKQEPQPQPTPAKARK